MKKFDIDKTQPIRETPQNMTHETGICAAGIRTAGIRAAGMFISFLCVPELLIRSSGNIAALFDGGGAVSSALLQLRTASISVPVLFAAVCASACGAAVYFRRRASGKIIKAGLTALTVLAAAASLFFSLWLTKVNGVRVHTAVKILTEILSSGVL